MTKVGIAVCRMSEKPLPQIDYTRIRFPSDSVTIGRLRAVAPFRLDVDEPQFIDEVGMLTVERSLARQAFDAVLGRPIPDENENWHINYTRL